MNRIKIQKSLPIIIIICFIFVLIAGFGFLWPKYQELSFNQLNIQDKKEEFQYKEKYFSDLNQIKTELGNYQVELSKINSALPDDSSLPSLFSFLQKATSQSGLILKGLSPFSTSLSEEISGLRKTHFSLSVAGSYTAFKNFLSILENSARIIEVENISFSSPKEGDLFSFNLRIKVFSY